MTISSASHQAHMMSQEHLELGGRRNGIAHLLRFTIDITNSSCKGNSTAVCFPPTNLDLTCTSERLPLREEKN